MSNCPALNRAERRHGKPGVCEPRDQTEGGHVPVTECEWICWLCRQPLPNVTGLTVEPAVTIGEMIAIATAQPPT